MYFYTWAVHCLRFTQHKLFFLHKDCTSHSSDFIIVCNVRNIRNLFSLALVSMGFSMFILLARILSSAAVHYSLEFIWREKLPTRLRGCQQHVQGLRRFVWCNFLSRQQLSICCEMNICFQRRVEGQKDFMWWSKHLEEGERLIFGV